MGIYLRLLLFTAFLSLGTNANAAFYKCQSSDGEVSYSSSSTCSDGSSGTRVRTGHGTGTDGSGVGNSSAGNGGASGNNSSSPASSGGGSSGDTASDDSPLDNTSSGSTASSGGSSSSGGGTSSGSSSTGGDSGGDGASGDVASGDGDGGDTGSGDGEISSGDGEVASTDGESGDAAVAETGAGETTGDTGSSTTSSETSPSSTTSTTTSTSTSGGSSATGSTSGGSTPGTTTYTSDGTTSGTTSTDSGSGDTPESAITITPPSSDASNYTVIVNGKSYDFSLIPPSENVDGSEINPISQYVVYLGDSPDTNNFSMKAELNTSGDTIINVSPAGTYYASIVAIDGNGYQSNFSNVVEIN